MSGYKSLQGKANPVTVTYADGTSEIVAAGAFQKYGPRATYRRYLRSAKWQKKRKAAMKRDEYRCVVCRKGADTVKLEVHHKTYARVYDEHLDDLATVCRQCHTTEHQWAQRRGLNLTVEGRKM